MASQGPFDVAIYEGDVGTFKYPIKVQPETVGLTLGGTANSSATGDATEGLPSAKVSGSRRAIGVHPRTVTIKVTATGVTTGNPKGTILQIPVLTKAAYASYTKGKTGLYQDDTVVVVNKTKENIV